MAAQGDPCPKGRERAVRVSVRAYRALLRSYPCELRDEYGEEMGRCFRDLCRDELRSGGSLGLARLWAHTLPELLYTACKERLDMMSWSVYRTAVVLGTALALLVPLVAMQFSDDVVWGVADFVVAGILLVGAGLAFERIARKLDSVVYRAAVAVAVGAALLLVWVNLAVGIIGSEDDPANVMYIGVLAVGFIGAIASRFRPHGMARTMLAMALAQALAAVVALIAGWDTPESGPVEILGATALFVAMFTASALLFQNAARAKMPATAGRES